MSVQDRLDGWDGDYDYIVIGRLKTGMSMAQGVAELAVLTKQMIATHKVESQPHPAGRPLQDVIGGSVRTSLLVLLGAVLALLLIVCVNLANLTTAREWQSSRVLRSDVAGGGSHAAVAATVD